MRQANAHVMAEGYLSEAWRLLGEGLGSYVFRRTGDQALRGTRDVYAILQKMMARGNWDRYFNALGRKERNWASELLGLRNDSWAHQGIYSDEDIHHYVGVMVRLLRSIGAKEQADSVGDLHTAIGRLIYGQDSGASADSRSQIIVSLPEGIGEMTSLRFCAGQYRTFPAKKACLQATPPVLLRIPTRWT